MTTRSPTATGADELGQHVGLLAVDLDALHARTLGEDGRDGARAVRGHGLERGDQLLDPLVVRLERVLAEHGALGLVVELEVHPVDGEVAPALLGPA